MHIPFLPRFVVSPFQGLLEYVEKVKECAWTFQQAMECRVSAKCTNFEELRQNAVKIKTEAWEIGQKVRKHKRIWIHVNKIRLFMYLKEQDNILDAVEDSLAWLSYRPEPGIPKELEKEFFLLVDAIIDPIEELTQLSGNAAKYFKSFKKNDRAAAMKLIPNIHKQKLDARKAGDMIKRKVFSELVDTGTMFHMVRLAEAISSIADHAEKASNIMQAMLTE